MDLLVFVLALGLLIWMCILGRGYSEWGARPGLADKKEDGQLQPRMSPASEPYIGSVIDVKPGVFASSTNREEVVRFGMIVG